MINASNVTIAEINSLTNQKLENITTIKLITKNIDDLENVMLNLMKVANIYTIERKFV